MDSPFGWPDGHDGTTVYHGDDRTPVDFSEEPVLVVAEWDSGSGFCYSDCCALVALSDGRFAAWESWEDVTGSGFCEDAYGGDAEVHIGPRDEVVRFGLSRESRERLGLLLDDD